MPTYHRIPDGAIKVPVPDTRQRTDVSCGASSLQAVCGYYGVGPEEEEDYVSDMDFDPRVGSHPHHIQKAAREYGLRCREHQPMTVQQLIGFLDQGRPVLLMIQAWGKPKHRRVNYKGIWTEGHWVVAIGYDKTGVLIEDPSLAAVRGYLSYEDLDARWHDTGPYGAHLPYYGLAVWRPNTSRPPYLHQARVIE